MRYPPNILPVTSSYTEDTSGIFRGYEINGSGITLTLHSPATRDVKYISNAGTSDATIATAGTSATIDGSTTITLVAGNSVTLVANGQSGSSANWMIVGSDTGEASGNLVVGSITGNDSSLGVTGQAAAQGGAILLTGGTSSTTGNAGGAVGAVGGTPGATGTGGAVNLTGGVSGSSGARDGGGVNLTGGAGHATSTGKGGAVALTGGASGGGATGNGGAVTLTGGAAASTAGDGGDVVVVPGAKTGSGIAGNAILRTSAIFYKQTAATTDNADTPYTLTAAEMIGGISSMTPTTGRAVTTLTGSQISAAVASTNMTAGDAFEFSVQNRAAFAATDDIITLTAGASGVTVTGSAVVSPGTTARFRCVFQSANTWIIYKIAG